ncbi:hypothetical protein [Nonomuraea jabiensis]|uniref:hypothetical protein n=1 Tax=Nonomuraea jabiensis TaxID=882448 RepID=UPI003D75AB95
MAGATFLIVVGAQGNEEAIRQAKTSWINALGGTLGVEGQIMPGIETVRRATTGWDAADQDMFEAALNAFNSQIGALKTAMEYMGEGLGHLADSYAAFDMSLRYTGASLIITLVALKIAQRFPQSMIAAKFGEKIAVETANIAVIAAAGQLGGFLLNFATQLRDLRSAMLNIRTVLPSGPGAVDFQNAQINTEGLPPFQQPPDAPNQLPPGSDDFDWNLPVPDPAG